MPTTTQPSRTRQEHISTTMTTTAPSPTTADQLHERYYSFDTDTRLDETGHAYLPFHPTAFGFDFPFGPQRRIHFTTSPSSSITAAAAGLAVVHQPGRLVVRMMQNPVDPVGKASIPGNQEGRAGEALGTNAIRDWEHVNPSDMSFDIDRIASGESRTSTLISRAMDADDEEDEEESSSCASSRSASLEITIQPRVDTETTECVSRSRSVERKYSPVPPERTTQRKSSGQSDVDEDKGSGSGKGKNKKIKLAAKRTPSNTSSGSISDSNSNCHSSTSAPTSLSETIIHHPDSAFHITEPPSPFSFRDLGLQPPPPFCSAEDTRSGSGEENGDEDEMGKIGPDGVVVVVRGKRREMNRVAAKRHREKNKNRLKSLEKRKVWLDHAVAEYEKSNKRLIETLKSLKKENMMLKGIDVGA